MNIVQQCWFAFLAGLIVEGVCTMWVEAVSTRRARRAGVLSTCWALALLLGLEQALPNRLAGVFWALGYGLGSYLAVLAGRRAASKRIEQAMGISTRVRKERS